MTIEGVRARRNSTIDLRYSDWHRTLPRHCYCTDLDFIEFRNGRIVAFIEAKLHKDRMTDFQEKVFRELEERSGIPCYLVRYNEELTNFQVTRIKDYFVLGEFSESDYREWLSSLGTGGNF